MITLIIFMTLTFFLVSKLGTILGMKIGFKQSKENLHDFLQAEIEEVSVSTIDKKLSDVSKIYKKFDKDVFLSGAQKAFEIIFTAYAEGDVSTLQKLLSRRVFQAFKMAIDDRKLRKEKLDGMIVRFISAEIIDAIIDDGILIEVLFVTEQSNVLKSEDGNIIEGNSDFIEERKDIWVFSRDKKSTDSKWYLNEIKNA